MAAVPMSMQPQRQASERASASSLRDVKIADAPNKRIAIRLVVSTIRFELTMLAVVLFYCVLVFAELAIDDPDVSALIDGTSRGGQATQSGQDALNAIHDAFLIVDLIFLIFFTVEILIKLYGFGLTYLKDLFNSLDAIIVVGSFIITCVAVEEDRKQKGGSSEELQGSLQILQVIKVVRLVRVVLAMTRLQRSRDRYRRTKMCGIAAPVERVFEMITELRGKVKEEDDEKTLAWTMELIAKEQLYTGSFVSQSNHHLMSAEMTAWVRSNLQVHFHSPQERLAHEKTSQRRTSLSGGDSFPGTSGSSGGQALGKLARQRSAQCTHYTPRGAGAIGGGATRASQPEHATVVDATPWLTEILLMPSVSSVLAKCDEWDFDVFALDKATNGRPIVVGGMSMMQRMGIIDRLNLPRDKLAKFLDATERRYREANPFHNRLHGVDVVFTLAYFLSRPMLRDMLGPLDKCAALIAAAVHDFGHPGLSNAFLVASRHENAILYNDQSVLEMYHISGAWRTLLTEPGCNFTEGFSRDQYRQMREGMVSMVLATDLKYHFEHLGRLKTRLMSDAFVTVDRKDVLFLMGQVVHAADISNPAKTPSLQFEWTKRVMTEFFMQGDMEAAMGLPVSAFMNRETTSVAQCQMGFIKVLVMPLYTEIRKLLGDECQICIDTLQATLHGWETDGNALCEGWDLSHTGKELNFDYVHPVR